MTLAEFVGQCQGLPLDEFLRRYPHPFLLLESTEANPVEETGPKTHDPNRPTSAPSRSQPRPRDPPAEKATDLVFPGTKAPGAPFQQMITIGRAGISDVALKFDSVSKFHAYLAKDAVSGRYFVCDAGSTNGTLVNRKPIARGEKRELDDGDRVCFGGDVELSFFTSEGLHRYLPVVVRRLAWAQA